MEKTTITVSDELSATAESSFHSGSVEIGEFRQGADVYVFEGPAQWQVTVTNTGDALLVMGSIAGAARTSCARCLEPVVYDLDGEIEGYFLIPGVDKELTEEEEEEFFVLGEDHVIDLEPLFSAALSLACPLTPLCDDDCKGLCPRCGADLNEGPCACEPEEEDDSSNPFAVLKSLTFEEDSDSKEPGA